MSHATQCKASQMLAFRICICICLCIYQADFAIGNSSTNTTDSTTPHTILPNAGSSNLMTESHSNETTTVKDINITTTKPPASDNWYGNSIREIAYYLRAHKFNEYDRRYETKSQGAAKEFYRYFPKPPLRSLHWEVHKFCEPSFKECVQYIQKKIKQTGFKREDDTIVVMTEQKWSFAKNKDQINQVNDECMKAQKSDDLNAFPFEGPIERFQWRTTASYYMCMYTMQSRPELEHISDNCDNFANCLDPRVGPSNDDARAKDDTPFACALYSFCPDPCCKQREVIDLNTCYESQDNPCYKENSPGMRQCSVNRTENVEFRWNVTCNCPKEGYRWNSLYGMCVDVDECTSASHNCDLKVEACVNLQGGYKCACKWGHAWDPSAKKCLPSPALDIIKLHRNDTKNKNQPTRSIIERFLDIFRGKSDGSD